jgi:hypothetical protein
MDFVTNSQSLNVFKLYCLQTFLRSFIIIIIIIIIITIIISTANGLLHGDTTIRHGKG